MEWTFNELDDNLEAIASEIPRVIEGMAVILANDVQVMHKKRLDNGEPRKQYKSEAYKRFRERLGRQSDYIDMQLSGEFVRSMKTGVEGGDVVYGVQNTKVGRTDTSTIYKGQIERNGHADLLSIRISDTTRGIEAANRYFTEEIRRLFDEV